VFFKYVCEQSLITSARAGPHCLFRHSDTHRL